MSSGDACSPTPVPDVQGDNRWLSLHERFVSEAKEREADVILIGDSLVQQMKHFAVWEKFFQPLHSLNFGIGGDQTQHVLWRVENGEFDGFSPRIVVLLVGTNNHGHSAQEVAEGILAIVTAIRQRQEKSHVVVVEIPPRGKLHNDLRDKLKLVNETVAEKVKELDRATFLSVDWSAWIGEGGEISHLDMYDYLHFTQRGYEKLCEPLAEEIQNVLGEFGPQ